MRWGEGTGGEYCFIIYRCLKAINIFSLETICTSTVRGIWFFLYVAYFSAKLFTSTIHQQQYMENCREKHESKKSYFPLRTKLNKKKWVGGRVVGVNSCLYYTVFISHTFSSTQLQFLNNKIKLVLFICTGCTNRYLRRDNKMKWHILRVSTTIENLWCIFRKPFKVLKKWTLTW